MAVRILAGRYELNERIGEGGMAVVFRSRDRLLDRNVAIKILRPEYTKDLMFIDSFRKESQLAASIVDPNIVNVYDVGKEGNIYYIVMELVEGEPLSDIIKREAPLDPRRAVSITRQIAMALSTAHKHQLIHRDVKPHNILISEGDTAKISDFGIAIKVDPSEAMSTERKDSVMGSIHYFSPEQARGAYVDERSDIYSLGIVLYEMLTGQVPFDGETAVEVALKHMNEPMVPPSRLNPDIPQDLEDIIMKATAKIQTNRYASADEMITDLSFVKYSRPSDYAVSLANGTADRDTDEKSDETPEEKRARIRAEKRAERRKKLLKKLGIGVGVVALIVALVLIIGKIITRGNSRSFPAPYLIGMTYNEALVYLKDFELKAEIELELISEEPAGTIISQSPVEDTMVKPGQTIKVNVSRGADANAVPVLAGKTQAGAKNALEALGYKLGEVRGEKSDTVPKGFVISQDPEAGSVVEPGSSVSIVVSLGPDESGDKQSLVTVPPLTGKTLDVARIEITKAGLKLGNVTEQQSTTVLAGIIISQSLSPGSQAEKDTAVDLIISTGPPAPKEGRVKITIDYSKAKEDSFQVTVTLQDGDTSSNVFVEKRTRTSPSDSLELRGMSQNAKVRIVFAYESGSIDNAFEYTVDFQAGTVK